MKLFDYLSEPAVLTSIIAFILSGIAGIIGVWPFFDTNMHGTRRVFAILAVAALVVGVVATIIQAAKSREDERTQTEQFRQTQEQFTRTFMPLQGATITCNFTLDTHAPYFRGLKYAASAKYAPPSTQPTPNELDSQAIQLYGAPNDTWKQTRSPSQNRYFDDLLVALGTSRLIFFEATASHPENAQKPIAVFQFNQFVPASDDIDLSDSKPGCQYGPKRMHCLYRDPSIQSLADLAGHTWSLGFNRFAGNPLEINRVTIQTEDGSMLILDGQSKWEGDVSGWNRFISGPPGQITSFDLVGQPDWSKFAPLPASK